MAAEQVGEEVMKAARSAEDRRARSVWLHAWHDPVAGLKSFSPCVRLADLQGDGDSKLLVASSDKKLKIYTGTTLLSENVLLDAPVSICTFYPDAKPPRTPLVAVAAGPFVFIYKNLRPWYKFSLPPLVISDKEQAAWAKQREGGVNAAQLHEELTAARDAGAQLTSASQEVLQTDDADAAAVFISEQCEKPLTAQTVCTCMETLKKDLEDEDAISMLVVGTESGLVYIMEPSGTAVLLSVQVRVAAVEPPWNRLGTALEPPWNHRGATALLSVQA